MARHLAWLLVLSLGSVAPVRADVFCEQQSDRKSSSTTSKPSRQDGPRKWWLDPGDRKMLGIADQQSQDLNEIWEALAPKQRETWHELQRLEDQLSRTIKDGLAKPYKEGKGDTALVSDLAEQVEGLRAKLNKNRVVTLYRMNLLLSPDQRAKVKEMMDRRDEERRRQERDRRY